MNASSNGGIFIINLIDLNILKPSLDNIIQESSLRFGFPEFFRYRHRHLKITINSP